MTFREDIRRPFNIISLILAAIGIALAIIFYFYSRQEKRIAYLIQPQPSKIFDSKASSPNIRLIDQNGNLIIEDVYVLEVIIWNAGDLPIEPSEARRPLGIELTPSSKILDMKILSQTYPDIAKFRVYESPDTQNQRNSKLINIQWDHFDPNFGVKLQIIYTGTDKTYPRIDGYIVGVNEFENGKDLLLYRYLPVKLPNIVLAFLIIFGALGSYVLILFLFVPKTIMTRISDSEWLFRFFAIISSAWLLLIGYGLIRLMSRTLKPPL